MAYTSFDPVDKKSFQYIFSESIYRIREKSTDPENQEILIVLSTPAEHSRYSQLLNNILQATGIEAEKIKMLYKESLPQDLEQNYKALMSFGVSPKNLKLDLKIKDTGLLNENNIWYLFSHSLADLDTDKEKKKELWGNLQKLLKNL